MEQRALTPEALSLLEGMREKMLLLYPPIDSASDEMMSEGRPTGVYAIGFALRSQYWSLWKDWEKLNNLVGFGGFANGMPVIDSATSDIFVS